MKFILTLIIGFLLVGVAQSAPNKHQDSALETNGVKVEYYETSKRGIIRPIGCSLCILKIYHFTSDIKIKKDNQPITLEAFMSDYWNAKYPTLFIDLKTNKVLRVSY